MSHTTPTAPRRLKPWMYAVLTLLTLATAAVLSHQSEEGRLRQAEQETASRLRSDLTQALDFASALQEASLRTPQLSTLGDTMTFALPVADGRVEEMRLFVDSQRGGLCLVHSGRSIELMTHTVDAFHATVDRRSDGRPVLWVELSAAQSRQGEPPLRQHVYRSIVLDARPGAEHG